MVDLAKQAFSSKNFDLAAEIYERSIREYGPKPEFLLGLADCFAKLGQFERAFTAYSKACRVGPMNPKDLKHLVSSLVNTVKQDPLINSEMNKNVVFDCLICRNMLYDPVTIPCGHTFCRQCLVKDASKQCKNCGTKYLYLNISRIKSSVLLSQTIDKWFPEHSKAVEIKKMANDAFQTCRFEEAIRLYTGAMELVPNDHLLWSNRSFALSRLDRNEEALEDADMILQLRPDWPKGYFRRGCALYNLGQYEESVVALLQCLALDSSIETAKDYLSKALHNIILPLSPDNPKATELQRELNPSLLDQLIRTNFDCTVLLPKVTVDTVKRLKDIITDTVNSATNFLEGKDHHQPSQPNLPQGTRKALLKDPSLVCREDFECSLCYRLLHLPVSTPCGHVFCRPCLDKCLDHKTECPLCKSCLAEYLAERRQSVTIAIENIIEAYFPEDCIERMSQHEEEIQELASMGLDSEHDIPIFVCTLAYPYVSCPLHIFEPRYRLMVRQCMESGRRQFGMCVANGDEESQFSEYGCMLEIRDVQFFPDGRSLVDCVGGKRFKVIGKGQRDGYNTAKVEFISDHPVADMEEVRGTSERLYLVCRKWWEELPQVQRAQILQHLGEFPGPETESSYGPNGSAWHWWMLAVLPLDSRIQLAIIAMTSYKERLRALERVLGFLKNKHDSR
ncbi:LONF3-like protein [Mya arenaria]|uniref:LONF3-like protein n=1 Tax=Mya arenaria TaxID=6604 RepID=A0ABY7DUV4_MYAAR|nr:LONF3-like protein [Mya arenaria]